jgi:HD superfamily phosphodiesterase
MVIDENIVEWAAQQTESLIASLGNRWLHIQGVVRQARHISKIFNKEDRLYLISAAYLHDIGYAPALHKTGFHPIDGAYYLRVYGQERLASLVAYHSEAQFEAHLRNLASELSEFPREHSPVADALTYCDMTTNPIGEEISFEERIADILQRYDEKHIVHQAIREAEPALALAVEHTQLRLRAWQSGMLWEQK